MVNLSIGLRKHNKTSLTKTKRSTSISKVKNLAFSILMIKNKIKRNRHKLGKNKRKKKRRRRGSKVGCSGNLKNKSKPNRYNNNSLKNRNESS